MSTSSHQSRPPARGGHPFGGAQLPAEKPLNFKATARRLVAMLRPERWRVVLVILLGAASVALSVAGPKVLGNATTVVFEGFLSGEGVDFPQLHRILWAVAAIYV